MKSSQWVGLVLLGSAAFVAGCGGSGDNRIRSANGMYGSGASGAYGGGTSGAYGGRTYYRGANYSRTGTYSGQPSIPRGGIGSSIRGGFGAIGRAIGGVFS